MAIDILHRPWETDKPVLVNDDGCEWYLDKYFTKTVRTTELDLPALDDVVCYFIKKGSFITRVAVINGTDNIVAESTSLATFYDLLNMERVRRHFSQEL